MGVRGKRSFLSFHMFGIEVRPHWSLVAAVVLLAWYSIEITNGILPARYAALIGLIQALVLFTIVLLHELGHCLGAWKLGVSVGHILLTPLGGTAVGTGINTPAGFPQRVIELLVDHGADVAARGADGRTPADLAEANGHGEIAELIGGRKAPSVPLDKAVSGDIVTVTSLSPSGVGASAPPESREEPEQVEPEAEEPAAKVDEDTVVCIIEAMKVMNEIKAETEGTIVEITAENGEAVEFGQVLFKVRPTG